MTVVQQVDTQVTQSAPLAAEGEGFRVVLPCHKLVQQQQQQQQVSASDT